MKKRKNQTALFSFYNTDHEIWLLSFNKYWGGASELSLCLIKCAHSPVGIQSESVRVNPRAGLRSPSGKNQLKVFWASTFAAPSGFGATELYPGEAEISCTLKLKSSRFQPLSPPVCLSLCCCQFAACTLAVSFPVSTLWVSGLPISTWSLTGLIWCKYLQGKPWNWWTVMSSRFCTIGKR